MRVLGKQAAAELIRAGEIGRETARVFHVAPLEFAGGHFFREDDARFAVGVAPGDDDLHAEADVSQQSGKIAHGVGFRNVDRCHT